jgi:hypothetical protein
MIWLNSHDDKLNLPQSSNAFSSDHVSGNIPPIPAREPMPLSKNNPVKYSKPSTSGKAVYG